MNGSFLYLHAIPWWSQPTFLTHLKLIFSLQHASPIFFPISVHVYFILLFVQAKTWSHSWLLYLSPTPLQFTSKSMVLDSKYIRNCNKSTDKHLGPGQAISCWLTAVGSYLFFLLPCVLTWLKLNKTARVIPLKGEPGHVTTFFKNWDIFYKKWSASVSSVEFGEF